MHTHVCAHIETHTCAHRHNSSYMQTEKPADLQHVHMCAHRHRWPHRLGSRRNPDSDTYTPMHIHTHAGRDADTLTCIQPQKALHASKQGIPWGWAQCPHPRWHRHEVINAANCHQLPRSLPAAAGGAPRPPGPGVVCPDVGGAKGPPTPLFLLATGESPAGRGSTWRWLE